MENHGTGTENHKKVCVGLDISRKNHQNDSIGKRMASNAIPFVLDIADRIIDSNDMDGAAKFIEENLL